MIENKKLQANVAVERFRKRRRITKVLVAIGITAVLIHASVMGVEFRFEFATASDAVFRGIALLGVASLFAGVVFHSFVQNCPVCTTSFRNHKDFDEGLPVFNALYDCPFCLTPIDANYESKASEPTT